MTTPPPIPILRFRPQAEGSERWFGTLEAAIMEIFWSTDSPRTIKQVWRALQASYRADIGYTTVACTVTRLCDKAVLERVGTRASVTSAWVFRVRCSEAEFVELQKRAIVQSLEEL